MKHWAWGMMVAGGLLAASSAQAMPMNYTAQIKSSETQYRTPEDMLSAVPIIGSIPRSFLFGDGFKVHLGTKDLQIDHMAPHSHAPVKSRQCMIGLSYMTPVAGFFTTRVDVPLFNAQTPALADWGMSSFGDYVLKLSRDSTTAPSLRLVASARF